MTDYTEADAAAERLRNLYVRGENVYPTNHSLDGAKECDVSLIVRAYQQLRTDNVRLKSQAEDDRKAGQQLATVKKSLYGELVSVGGATQCKAKVILFSTGLQQDITLDGRDMAKELAGRLYDYVGFSGIAKVDLLTGEILSYKASRVLPYAGKAADPVAAMRYVESISPGVWGRTNVGEFVSELRDDEE